MTFRLEAQLAQSEETLKSLSEMREQAYEQVAKIMMFTVNWKDLTDKFETLRTDLLEQAKELASQERKLVEDSNLLERTQREAEIKLRRTDEEIQIKETELSSIKSQIEDTLTVFSLREKELNECDIELSSKKLEVEGYSKELSLKKAELGLVKKNLEECHKDFCLKNDRLNECSYDIQVNETELSLIKTKIQDTWQEFKIRTNQLNEYDIELNSKKQRVEECGRELILKEEEFGLVKKNLEECQKDFFLKKNLLNECSDELQMKEKQLDLKRKEQKQLHTLIEGSKKEYDLLKQKMSGICKSIEERSKELDSKKLEFSSIEQLIGEYNEELVYEEKKYDEMKNSVDEVAKKLKLKERELKVTENSVNEKSVKLHTEEKKLDSIRKCKENEEKKLNSLKVAVKHNEDCQKELELNKEQLRSVKLEIEKSIVELQSVQKLITECSGKLESEVKNLDFVKTSLEDCCNKLTSKEVQQGVIHVICGENLRELLEQKTHYDSLKRTMEKREEELQNREKQLQEKVKMLESTKQQKLDVIPLVELEQLECSSSAKSHFSASAGVKSPELLLDDYVIDPNLTIEEISNDLQFSPDPAKLVLDVLRGTYFQFQDNGSAGFDDCSNVVLLLERLMKISPNISPQLKEIALPQGLLWKETIKSKTQNSIEILAFLMFLAVYNLGSNFKRDEILILVKAIVHYKQAPEICRAICFIDDIAFLTASLIQSKQFLEAARFSKTFELSSKFSPKNILRNCLESINTDVMLSANGSNSFQEQFKIMDKEAVALKTFWECVIDCQLESTFPVESCMQYIEGRARLAHSLFHSPHMSWQPQEVYTAQQSNQSRNLYMVSASNPSNQLYLGTGKRPRLDSIIYGSPQGSIPPQYGHQGSIPPQFGHQGSILPQFGHQGSIPPQYGYQGGYFPRPN